MAAVWKEFLNGDGTKIPGDELAGRTLEKRTGWRGKKLWAAGQAERLRK
jgi:hypothetical protein